MSDTNANISLTPYPLLWLDEAVVYLGLDRLGLKKPEQAIYRLVSDRKLPNRKISGRLAFTKEELDNLIANNARRKRGRPRKRKH